MKRTAGTKRNRLAQIFLLTLALHFTSAIPPVHAQLKLRDASALIQDLFAPTIWYLGGAVAAVMIVLSIAKLIGEDDGNPTRPLFLFIRIMICTALFSQITPILNGFEQAKADV